MNGKPRLPYSQGYHKHSQTSPNRVLKACDRCRLKKTKCDGRRPCSRCEGEDTVCSFAMPKKFRNVVHPKGSVEMLLQQQEWLVSGLLELYRRTQLACGPSSDSPPDGPNGLPSVHNILEQLGVLEEGHSYSPPHPGLVAPFRQHIYEKPSDMYETASYSPRIAPGDNHVITFEDGGPCYQTFAPPATDRILFSPSGDHFSPFLELHDTPHHAPPTLSSHSDTEPSWDYDLTTRLNEPGEELLSVESKPTFPLSRPPEIYARRGSVLSANPFHQQYSTSPSGQNIPISIAANSIHHSLGSLPFTAAITLDQPNR